MFPARLVHLLIARLAGYIWLYAQYRVKSNQILSDTIRIASLLLQIFRRTSYET